MLGFNPLGQNALGSGPNIYVPPVVPVVPKINTSGIFSKQIVTAIRQIAKYGEKCTYIKGVPIASSGTPWNAADDLSAQFNNIPILWNYPNFRTHRPIMKEALSQSQQGYKLGFMAQQLFTPEIGDILIRADGTRWTLDDADVVEPNGIVIIWELVFCQ